MIQRQVSPQRRMKKTLLRWSRFLHTWLGIYIAVFTLVWLVELLVLPIVYSVSPVAGLSGQPAAGMSPRQVLNAVNSGVYGVPENLEFRYQPKTGYYHIIDKRDFSILTIDAATGKISKKELDFNTLLSEKSGLGWINQTLAGSLKIFFQIFFVILSVTGLYILYYPRMRN